MRYHTMSSHQTHWDRTSPTLKHEVTSRPEQQNMAASEHAAVIQPQVGDHERILTSLKKQARGKEKQTFTQRIGALE